jgi:hypothetical protein
MFDVRGSVIAIATSFCRIAWSNQAQTTGDRSWQPILRCIHRSAHHREIDLPKPKPFRKPMQ